jgi:hypothetical protein
MISEHECLRGFEEQRAKAEQSDSERIERVRARQNQPGEGDSK